MRRHARLLLLVACAAIVSGAYWLRGQYKQHVWFHFLEVKPGALYRSGQLSPSQLAEAIRRYGLKAVVNFRTAEEDPAAFAAEAEVCRRSNVEFIHLPMGYGAKETELQIDRFIDLAKNRLGRPILVHCRHGMTRTGFAVLAYRMRFDGWQLNDGIAELVHYGDPDDLRDSAKWVRISAGLPPKTGQRSPAQGACLPLETLLR